MEFTERKLIATAGDVQKNVLTNLSAIQKMSSEEMVIIFELRNGCFESKSS